MKKRSALMVGFFAIAAVVSSVALVAAMIPKPINVPRGVPIRYKRTTTTPPPFATEFTAQEQEDIDLDTLTPAERDELKRLEAEIKEEAERKEGMEPEEEMGTFIPKPIQKKVPFNPYRRSQ